MNAYVSQSKLKGNLPVVANHQNIVKPPKGDPTLLTFDEVITMFHEFGHALHGMFSNVNYPYFSGTSVPRDFVEYPSQVNEMFGHRSLKTMQFIIKQVNPCQQIYLIKY